MSLNYRNPRVAAEGWAAVRALAPEEESERAAAPVEVMEASEPAAPAESTPARRLGHRTTHTPRLALHEYLETEAQPPPEHLHRGLFPGYADVLGNDSYGDCGDAMTVHGIMGMHHAAGTPVPAFVTADALALYSEVSGFDPSQGPPGSNPTDQGTDNDQLMAYWKASGVRCAADGSVHRIVGSVAVDPTSDVENRIAIYEFGALFRAVALPVSAQGQTEWTVVGDGRTGDSAPGSWGGHDVVGMAYDPASIDYNSWGIWTPATTGFDHAYAIGGYCVVAVDELSKSGVSPSGVNWSRLVADLQAL